MEPQVSSQQGGNPGCRRSRSPYNTYDYFRRSIKAPAESFAYRVVLNGIVLARSIREIVFTAYMTYRAFAVRRLHDASAIANRREPQSAPGLWRLHQAWLIGCRPPSWPVIDGFTQAEEKRLKNAGRQAAWDSCDKARGFDV